MSRVTEIHTIINRLRNDKDVYCAMRREEVELLAIVTHFFYDAEYLVKLYTY
jgi:cell division protein FtsB